MFLLDEAMELAGMRPLPDDAEDRLQAIYDRAKGNERDLIGQVFEAIIVARTMA